MSQRSLGNLTITGTQPKITPRREENDLDGENEENYLAFLRMRKSLRGRRSRVKRWCKWAFMASLCCGIFVSLTGIVVGFVVLAPFYAKGQNIYYIYFQEYTLIYPVKKKKGKNKQKFPFFRIKLIKSTMNSLRFVIC